MVGFLSTKDHVTGLLNNQSPENELLVRSVRIFTVPGNDQWTSAYRC